MFGLKPFHTLKIEPDTVQNLNIGWGCSFEKVNVILNTRQTHLCWILIRYKLNRSSFVIPHELSVSKWYTGSWSVCWPLIGQILTILASDWSREGESWPLHAAERNIITIFTPCQHFADQFHFLNCSRKIFDPILIDSKKQNHLSCFPFHCRY